MAAPHTSPVLETKADDIQVDHPSHHHVPLNDDHLTQKGERDVVVMKSSLDKLPFFKALKVYRRVVLVAMLGAFSASLDGYQINLNGSIIANKGFIQMFASEATLAAALAKGTSPSMDADRVSVWGGLQSTGQFLGQVTLPFASDKWGRKVAFFITWFILALSIAIESFASNWGAWAGAKLLAGVGVGMVQATLPMYIAELSPTQLRGFLINCYTFWFVVGQLMAPVALQRLNVSHPYDFRVAIYTQWAMIGILLVIFIYIPESPWWLVSHGKEEKARAILARHNAEIPNYDVDQEVSIMAATVEEEKRVSLANNAGYFDVVKGINGFRLLIAAWPKIAQQLVGLTVFNSYSTYFFQLAGNKDPFLVTVILACVQLISTLVFAFTTDSYGRRPLTLWGYGVTVASMLALGIIGFFDYASSTLGSLLVFFAAMATFSTTGASAIGYAYVSEIPQQQYRAKIAGWGLALSNLLAIMFSFCTPLMLKAPANWGPKAGLFFAGTGAAAVVVAYFILPEVARRTPSEIDEMFTKRVPPRKFKGYVTDVQRNAEAMEGRDTA